MQLKTLGAAFIVAGTSIGAGMLALPIETAPLSASYTLLLLVAMWAIMTFGALLTLEVNLAFTPPNNSFGSMAAQLLGPMGELITTVCLLALLYALTSAYTSGGAQMVQQLWNMLFTANPSSPWAAMPDLVAALLFITILGGLIVHSTRCTDTVNRLLFSLKIIVFLMMAAQFTPNLQLNYWQAIPYSFTLSSIITIMLTSFGFNVVVPSLSKYLQQDAAALRYAIIGGSMLPLFLYIFWILMVRGTIPASGESSMLYILQADGPLVAMVDTLTQYGIFTWLNGAASIFTNLAIATSFLGVALSLLHYLEDKLPVKQSNKLRRPCLVAGTFIPPLVFALIYPQGFIFALQYAGIFVLLLCLSLPAIMALQLRKHPQLHSSYTVAGGVFAVWFIIITSLLAVVWAVWNEWQLIGILVMIIILTSSWYAARYAKPQISD